MSIFYKEFRLVKPLPCGDNVLPIDTAIIAYNDMITIDGIPISPDVYPFFKNLINDEMENPEYLREAMVTGYQKQ